MTSFPAFTARRADLLRNVTMAARATERRCTIPILGNLMLTRTGGRLEIVGTNLHTEIKASVAVDDGPSGATCVPAARLAAILAALPDVEEVTVGEDAKGRVVLTAGRVEATFLALPASNFPTLTVSEPRWVAPLPEGAVAWLLGGVLEAVSTEETRYYLNGVCFAIQDGEAVTVATDGHRLLSRTLQLPAATPDVAQVVIPASAVKHMIALASRGEAELRGHASKPGDKAVNRLTFSTAGDATVTTKPVDGTYPDWRRCVPADVESVIEMRADDFRRAMALAKANSDQRTRGVKMERHGDEVRVSARDPDGGSIDAAFPCSGTGQLPSFGVNARYLDAMAANLMRAGSQTIRLQAHTPGNPIRMFSDERIKGTTSVVMPMRI